MNRPAATMPIHQVMRTSPVTVQPTTRVVEFQALFDPLRFDLAEAVPQRAVRAVARGPERP
jgi:hypothetical protein